MTFRTAINCIDGRAQLPVINYLKKRFGADYIDCITEPGANLILSEQNEPARVQAILSKVQISVEKHNSTAIAVAGHYDCAGNPAPEREQNAHTQNAVKFLKERYPQLEIIGLWVDENLQAKEVC